MMITHMGGHTATIALTTRNCATTTIDFNELIKLTGLLTNCLLKH